MIVHGFVGVRSIHVCMRMCMCMCMRMCMCVCTCVCMCVYILSHVDRHSRSVSWLNREGHTTNIRCQDTKIQQQGGARQLAFGVWRAQPATCHLVMMTPPLLARHVVLDMLRMQCWVGREGCHGEWMGGGMGGIGKGRGGGFT